MKISAVIFTKDLRLGANEIKSNITLSHGPDKRRYELDVNVPLRALVVKIIEGPLKGSSVLVPLEICVVHVDPDTLPSSVPTAKK